ncbi:MAG TPA: arginine--tRNA ligase [Deltaproteobacteria bacterium]|nr:arginine--tRNA ligase [Deltaproteobacteria bacterium]
MKNKLIGIIDYAINECVNEKIFELDFLPRVEVEVPANSEHGDYATNAAMILASSVKKNPRNIAEAIQSRIVDKESIISKTEIAGPGFINFFIKDKVWKNKLKLIEEKEAKYGQINIGLSKKIQVEFVSANPTGPLHIGHARGAVVGDVIANLLKATGYIVSKEYYINDAGNQMNNLGNSVYLRYRELKGERIYYPESCYQGDYIKDIAAKILEKDKDKHLKEDEKTTIQYFTRIAGGIILEDIKNDLADFGVIFDEYFSENKLYENDGVKNILDELRRKGFVYSDGETLWFKTSRFGDEKDRVVVRKTGEPTYFAADIAYHENKYSRGFDTVVDIWGADHHGYIPRMYAGIMALGHDKEKLKIVLVQLVNLLRAGQPVAMSTRAGKFVTLREVLDEVGKDAARYNFLMRRSDSHLDFDLELAKRQSNENPVYYVKYAHARICSILKIAEERGVFIPCFNNINPDLLKEPEEMTLIKMAIRYPEIIEGAVRSLEPHRIPFYINEMAAVFHSYYNKNKVISENRELTSARLFLVKTIRRVMKNALGLLGVDAPEKM